MIFLRNLLLGALLAGLAACQSVGGPTPAAVAKLQAIGYSSSTTTASSTAGAQNLGAFGCYSGPCGGGAGLAFASSTAPDMGQLSAEETARRGLLTNAMLRAIAAKGTADADKSGRVTGVTPLRSERYPGFLYSATAANPRGGRFFIRGRITFVGNTAVAIVSVAETDQQAARALAAAMAE